MSKVQFVRGQKFIIVHNFPLGEMTISTLFYDEKIP